MITKEKGVQSAGLKSTRVARGRVTRKGLPAGQHLMVRLVVAGVLVAGGGSVVAMEVGRTHMASAPGQPLRLTIPLRDLNAQDLQSLSVRVANSQQWAQAGLTPPVSLERLTARVIDGPQPNTRMIEVSADQPASANVVDLLIDVSTATTQRMVQSSVISRAAPAVRLSGQTYDVMRGDTLIGIAERFPVPGATLHQTLWALYQANPHAFVTQNMNVLRAGVSLSIPSSAQVLAIDPEFARQQYLAHVRAFNASRGRPGNTQIPAAPGAAASAPDVSNPSARGQVQSAGEQAQAAAATDRVRLSAADPSSQGVTGSPASVAADQQTSEQRARQEEQARTQTLERNIEALKGALAAAGTSTQASTSATPASGAGASVESSSGAQGAGGQSRSLGEQNGSSAGGASAINQVEGGSPTPGIPGPSDASASVATDSDNTPQGSTNGATGSTGQGSGTAATASSAGGTAGTSSPASTGPGAGTGSGVPEAVVQSDSAVEQVKQWVSDNTLAAGALILALFALIFAWVMRSSAIRDNASRDSGSSNRPSEGAGQFVSAQARAFEDKLKDISLELDEPSESAASAGQGGPASASAADKESGKKGHGGSSNGKHAKGKGRGR